VVAALDPKPDERVLDCCAAPGGKALFAASRMQGQGSLVALDVSEGRLRAVQATARRQRVPKSFLTCVAMDARQYCANAAASGELFDKVLLDAPCSGTGVLAKRADMRWRRKEEDLAQLCELQQGLLEAAALVVRPGGVLVYSTCSLEKEENEDMIESFLQSHPEFQLERLAEAELASALPPSCIGEDGALRMLPHRHETDGAYAARLRRRESTGRFV
jgi:16S rRNA (cytosine967-C5)-methyltransferase